MRPVISTFLISLSLLAGSARGSLHVDLEGVTDSLSIGDPLEIRISVSAPAEGQVVLPDWQEAIAPFELLAPPDSSSQPESESQRRLSVHLQATCYQAGVQVLQPIPIRWLSPDGSSVDSVETEPYVITVQGVVPDSILAIADTTWQPHHLLQPNRARILPYSLAEIAPWLLLILGAVGVFFLVRSLIRRRKKKTREIELGPPPRPPHEIALEALDRLRDLKLYQAGQIKPYYSDLSEIIRRYVVARFQVPAMESTSFQLLREVESRLANDNLFAVLEQLLADADLAKFAKHRPEAETCQKDLEGAYILVNRTKPKPQPILSGEAA